MASFPGGYEVLGEILRNKAQLINVTGFETMFEFLGMSFRYPECVANFLIGTFECSPRCFVANLQS